MSCKNELPKRKQMRLRGYDYSSCGAYYITICVGNRNALLWDNVGVETLRPHIQKTEQPPLSEYGKTVNTAINAISSHYLNVEVAKYCIMPDHVHMILLIFPDENGRIISAPTVSTVIGQMKRWVTKQLGFCIWQKSFHDRIIQNEKGYHEVCKYIDENPFKM